MGSAAPFIGPAVQLGQGVAAGASGKRAGRAADQRMSQFDQATDAMMGMGQDAAGMMMDAAQNFQNPELANQILSGAQGAAAGLGNIFNNAMGTIQGIQGPQAGQVGLNEFSFDPVQQIRQQAMGDFNQFAGAQRAMAAEQAGRAMTQGAAGVDAAMAASGMSRGSGPAAAAMAQLGAQQGQSMAQLNRDLAAQGQQAGLQAAQFDVGTGLQLGQMGSQYNLGFNQLGLGADAQRFGQQLQAGQFGMDQASQAAMMGAQALTSPIDMLQGIYQQNYLQPGMQAMGGLQNMMGQGMQAMMGGLELRDQQLQRAGSGKGSGIGGGAAGIGNAISGKG